MYIVAMDAYNGVFNLRILTMIPVLPTAISSAVKLPDLGANLSAQAIFQLGRLAASHENRAWAREKVRQAKTNLNKAVDDELQETGSNSVAIARDQLRDREQVVVSLERFYKKLRHETVDKFPETIAVMALMLPGSTHGLVPARPKGEPVAAVQNSLNPGLADVFPSP